MGVLLRFGAIFIVALKRLFSQYRLALLTVLGLTAAVALTLSIPLYADAVYYRTLREALGTGQGQTDPSSRPPFAFMFRYIGAWYGAAKWSDVQPVRSISLQFGRSAVGSTTKAAGALLQDRQPGVVRPASEDQTTYDTQHSLSWLSLGTISNIDKHITLIEGRLPITPTGSADTPIETLMSEQRAAELGSARRRALRPLRRQIRPQRQGRADTDHGCGHLQAYRSE